MGRKVTKHCEPEEKLDIDTSKQDIDTSEQDIERQKRKELVEKLYQKYYGKSRKSTTRTRTSRKPAKR